MDWLTQLFGGGAGAGMMGPPEMAGPNLPTMPDVGTPNPWDPAPPPVPMPRPQMPGMPMAGAPDAGTPGNFGGSPATNPNLAPIGAAPPSAGSNLANALKGVVAPKVPEPQKVATPHAYVPPGHLQGGELFKLLQMLHGTPGGLPTTLGQALGSR